MTKHSALVATACVSALLLALNLPAQSTDEASQTAGVSKVRIVRLSEVRGQVQLDRNNDRGYEPATANLPIVEGSKLQTGQGVAEVEFEDNSTLRIAPDSLVEFPQLERRADGTTASSVHLVKGMAYVSIVKAKPNEFNLLFGEQKVSLPTPSHVRLHLEGTEARLSVLDNNLRIDGPSGTMDVSKKKTITFDLLEHQQAAVAKDILPEPYDEWDQSSTGYHARAANYSAYGGSGYSYGLNDMSYYGNFVSGSSCGMGSMWRPYFASAAWDPYANGTMAYYQGAGYSWVSPYPWGWTPYHSGSWAFCQGTGWGWMPGNSWYGLNNMMAMNPNNPGNPLGSGASGPRRLPIAPPHPPRVGEPSMVAVNTKPLVRSEVASPESFVFRRDSAGMGVPRDAFGKLDKMSQHADTHGMVNQRIYLSVPDSAMGPGRPTSTAVMAGSIRRGSPPPPSSSMGGMQPMGGPVSGPSMGRSPGMSPSSGSMPSSRGPSSAPSSGPPASAGPRSH
ncbi:MAG TPA: DUF6600 domain-containing protein [Terracidiphilus sp.]|jgi:hypothetical protein|nr:DUF6600 domain-containing protein [Terracidiphilus sp.]